MRALFLIFSLILSGLAHGADSLSLAQQLYQTGAPRLALARVLRDQPLAADAPGWMEWESLRLTLLSQLGEPGELLQRIKLLPANVPQDFLQKAYGHAAWAHLERGEGGAARTYLTPLLWQFPLSAADRQWARRLVIRSYLVEHKPDEAYRAMLRYQQDFSPVSKEVAAEFTQGLLGEGRPTEAMTWLAELDPASPIALRLRMKAGMIAPDAAIKQAALALRSQPGSAVYNSIVADGAELAKNVRLRMAALEQVLNAEGTPTADTAGELWRSYLSQGEMAGNRAQLLHGDDASWLAMGAGVASADPLESRAVHAYLATRGASQGTRDDALSKLFLGLVASKLETAAVRLFMAAPWSGERASLETMERLVRRAAQGVSVAEARPLLMATGRYAAEQKRYEVAAEYYVRTVLASDMRTPDFMATQALKFAIENLERAGFRDDASSFYQQVVAQRQLAKKAPPPAKPEKGKRTR